MFFTFFEQQKLRGLHNFRKNANEISVFSKKYVLKSKIIDVWIFKIVEFKFLYHLILSTPTLIAFFQIFCNFEIISRWPKNPRWNIVKKKILIRFNIFMVQCTIKSWHRREMSFSFCQLKHQHFRPLGQFV